MPDSAPPSFAAMRLHDVMNSIMQAAAPNHDISVATKDGEFGGRPVIYVTARLLLPNTDAYYATTVEEPDLDYGRIVSGLLSALKEGAWKAWSHAG